MNGLLFFLLLEIEPNTTQVPSSALSVIYISSLVSASLSDDPPPFDIVSAHSHPGIDLFSGWLLIGNLLTPTSH